jgi:hypothetical protein
VRQSVENAHATVLLYERARQAFSAQSGFFFDIVTPDSGLTDVCCPLFVVTTQTSSKQNGVFGVYISSWSSAVRLLKSAKKKIPTTTTTTTAKI